MADKGDVHGLMVSIEDRVYFIPRDELRTYKLPRDAAATARAAMKASRPEKIGEMRGVSFNPSVPNEPPQFSSLVMHCVTVILQ